MATNSHSRGIVSLGKRFFNQIRSGTSSDPTQPLSLSFRRVVHESVYDKNPDDHVQPTLVPDEVTQPKSDKYWTPSPKTGVFGPAGEENPDTDVNSSSPANGNEESVLEQKAFYRPLEDLEKPLT